MFGLYSLQFYDFFVEKDSSVNCNMYYMFFVGAVVAKCVFNRS